MHNVGIHIAVLKSIYEISHGTRLLIYVSGSYHVYLVVNVFMGKPGYTFDEFPQFED
jgi:hypothetical protein